MNLLVIGLGVGIAWRHGPGRDHRPPPTAIALFLALPEQDRKILRDVSHQGTREAGERDNHSTSDIVQLLKARPFDPDRFAAHLQAQEAMRGQRLARMQQEMLSRIAAMSEDERTEYADRLTSLARKSRHKPWRD
ncbi:periplasmic heavy metal sensor [Ruegeria sp. WL0004]|uniref:Periplasmic heavy metal sensor n=1 Tax=Ruegeria marisflavi TaxID=2984152 RepID=A0ABT2WRF0_9RHOB|nr:periplasmic heavy metal sensor [Ruegeria sp. WL0004]MCU9838485.1 periplasmic heavy metal sensor [Ruegeria sp. WL0004]